MTFLREFISNAVQALDAVQFLSWYNASLLGEHAALDPSLKIKVLHDPVLKTLSVLDTGIGMTKTELITKFGKEAELWRAHGGCTRGSHTMFAAVELVIVVSKSNDD